MRHFQTNVYDVFALVHIAKRCFVFLCLQIIENLPLEPALQRELSTMCLRSLESVDVIIPPHVKRVQEFFLLMAVCNTVVVSHHPHEDLVS